MKGKGFGAVLKGGAGSDTIWNGIIMVDPVNGNDASGQRNIINKPFQTIQAAYNAYQEGDLIRCLPGTHTLTSQLILDTFNEVHMDFFNGALVQGDLTTSLISSIFNPLELSIYGRGSFENVNATLGGGTAAIFGAGKLHIYSANSIHAVTGTLFGASNGVQVLENIDEMIADDSYELNFSTNDFTTPYQGIIRNCKKIGDLTTSQGMFFSMGSDDSAFFENCNFFSSGAGNGYSAFMATGRPQFKGCNFINESFRPVFVGSNASADFINCHFQQNSGGFEACNVFGDGTAFENCTFAHYGTGNAIRTSGACEFTGLNKFYAESNVQACAGTDLGVSLVSGTLLANVMNVAAAQASQTWIFQANETPPTVGETYTIDSPNGTESIDYLVQVADTRDDVINGLFAAWDAEVLANPTGYFADFDNKSVVLGPVVWRLQCVAVNPDDNLDPDNGFVLSTDGADSVQTILIALSEFAWKGNGKFIIDENMTVPNL